MEMPELLQPLKDMLCKNDITITCTAAALFACGMLKDLVRKKGTSLPHRETLEEMNNTFEEMAKDSIKTVYKEKTDDTMNILELELKTWGRMSLMEMAVDTKNTSFLSLDPCQKVLDHFWLYGYRHIDSSDFEVEGTRKFSCLLKEGLYPPFPPKVIFFFDLIALLLFLMGFALLIVTQLETEKFHFLEWILFTTVITLVLQEITQVYELYKDKSDRKRKQGNAAGETCTCIKTGAVMLSRVALLGSRWLPSVKILRGAIWEHLTDYMNFNITDGLSSFVYLLAFSLRVVAYHHSSHTQYMDAARALFSIAFALFTLRLLRCFYAFRSLGPVVHMIGKMVKIMLRFLVILAVFVLAYAVASEAVLYPESKMSWALVFHVLRKPYWSMYGELFLDELEADGSDHCTQCTTDPNLYDEFDQLRCVSQTGRYIVPVFLAIYVLMVNILLFNLLIAKFSIAVEDAEKRAIQLWSYQRVKLLAELTTNYILPFPLTILNPLVCLYRPRGSDDDGKPRSRYAAVLRKAKPPRLGIVRNADNPQLEEDLLRYQYRDLLHRFRERKWKPQKSVEDPLADMEKAMSHPGSSQEDNGLLERMVGDVMSKIDGRLNSIFEEMRRKTDDENSQSTRDETFEAKHQRLLREAKEITGKISKMPRPIKPGRDLTLLLDYLKRLREIYYAFKGTNVPAHKVDGHKVDISKEAVYESGTHEVVCDVLTNLKPREYVTGTKAEDESMTHAIKILVRALVDFCFSNDVKKDITRHSHCLSALVGILEAGREAHLNQEAVDRRAPDNEDQDTPRKTQNDILLYNCIKLISNCALLEKNKQRLRDVGAVEAVLPYAKSEISYIQAASLVAIAKLKPEILTVKKKKGEVRPIKKLIGMLKEAIKNKDHREDKEISVAGIIIALGELAKNKEIRKALVDEGCLPVMEDVLDSRYINEVTGCLKALERLSRDENNKRKMAEPLVRLVKEINNNENLNNEMRKLSQKIVWRLEIDTSDSD